MVEMQEATREFRQYEIQQERIWRYNDLIWKNFLVYGTGLFGISKLSTDSIPLAVAHDGLAFGLLVSALIQLALVMGHRATVKGAHHMEKIKGYDHITGTMRGPLTVFTTYSLAASAMLGIAFTRLLPDWAIECLGRYGVVIGIALLIITLYVILHFWDKYAVVTGILNTNPPGK